MGKNKNKNKNRGGGGSGGEGTGGGDSQNNNNTDLNDNSNGGGNDNDNNNNNNGGGDCNANSGNGGGDCNKNRNNNNSNTTTNNNNGGMDIVFKLNLHCDACRNKINKSVLCFPGVKEVKFEGDYKLKVSTWTKNNDDPLKLQKLLEKKMKAKKVEIISPQPKKDANKNHQNQEPKEKEIAVTTVVLKVAWDCDCNGCGDKIYNTLSSYKGVHEVSIDQVKDLVTVTGRIDPLKIVEMLKDKLKKTVEIVPTKNNQNSNNGNNKHNGAGGGGKGGGLVNEPGTHWSGHKFCDESGQVVNPFYYPQIFCDENPHACSIM